VLWSSVGLQRFPTVPSNDLTEHSMPLYNPAALRRLLNELEALDDTHSGADIERRREDLHYTLCVSTGVREPARAVEQARRLLAPSRDTLAPAA